MAAMFGLCTMPSWVDPCCSELTVSIFQVWIAVLFTWDPLAPHFWRKTTAKPHLADGQSRVPDAFGRSQGLFWGLHAMKLPPPRSRFLMFELMKSRLQEEHVAPALGYFRQPAQTCSNRRGCQTLHLRLFAAVSHQPDPIASPK